MSDSVRPHRRQPNRLPRPWDSPGKNEGVGCHFLLQCMKMKSESEVTQSCLTLSDPMDCSLLGSCIHGIFQARVLEWGAIAFSTHVSSGHHIGRFNYSWILSCALYLFTSVHIGCISPHTAHPLLSLYLSKNITVSNSVKGKFSTRMMRSFSCWLKDFLFIPHLLSTSHSLLDQLYEPCLTCHLPLRKICHCSESVSHSVVFNCLQSHRM